MFTQVSNLRLALCSAAVKYIFWGALGLTPVVHANQFEHTAIFGRDLTQESIYLEEAWKSGLLRVAITGIPSSRWTIRFDYGNAGSLELNEISAIPRAVSTQGSRMVVDLPVVPGATVTATSTNSGMRVKPLEVITIPPIFPEQMLPGSSVSSLKRGQKGDALRVSNAFARAELLTESASVLGYCTAFRIAPQYWLTAAHCAYRTSEQSRAPMIASLRLQPNAYANEVEPGSVISAHVVASGLALSSISPAALMSDTDLDYAVLKAEGDLGTDVLRIDMTQSAPPGTRLVLFQYWQGEMPPAAGKARSDGESCMVNDRAGANDASRPDLCPGAIQHGCSSQRGASGGPLLDATGYKLVALHYRAGILSKFNCGLPVAAIANDLCKRYPTIAKEVVPCP